MSRECGSCTACCKTIGVEELKKPPGRPCRHQKGGRGCNIYETRPDSCREFRCEWLKGFGAEDHRPNKTKIVLDCRQLENLGEGSIVQMWEAEINALASAYADQVMQFCIRNGLWVSHMPKRGQKRLFIPPDVSIEIVRLVRAQAKEENFEVHSATWAP